MKRELANRVDTGWLWYGANTFTESDKVGKFMTFGKGYISDELQGLILKAIKQGVTPLVKHINLDTITFNPRAKDDTWVIVWYSSDDENCLKSLAKLLVDEGLVPKTKTGKLLILPLNMTTEPSTINMQKNLNLKFHYKNLRKIK
ncbi:MAG: hypothetical protein K0S25_1725 [Bacillus sp. (in: firmicutes)]|jgi:hypothetical protein|nr:hypothetical protein [Bacillus sp. (in: firmicutes)]